MAVVAATSRCHGWGWTASRGRQWSRAPGGGTGERGGHAMVVLSNNPNSSRTGKRIRSSLEMVDFRWSSNRESVSDHLMPHSTAHQLMPYQHRLTSTLVTRIKARSDCAQTLGLEHRKLFVDDLPQAYTDAPSGCGTCLGKETKAYSTVAECRLVYVKKLRTLLCSSLMNNRRPHSPDSQEKGDPL